MVLPNFDDNKGVKEIGSLLNRERNTMPNVEKIKEVIASLSTVDGSCKNHFYGNRFDWVDRGLVIRGILANFFGIIGFQRKKEVGILRSDFKLSSNGNCALNNDIYYEDKLVINPEEIVAKVLGIDENSADKLLYADSSLYKECKNILDFKETAIEYLSQFINGKSTLSRDVLKKLLKEEISLPVIGEMWGISERSVRYWIEKYKLEYK